MVIEIKIPSPGESVTEAQLSAWLVKDGDYVQKDQELAEIESDKATLPLIAAENGKIKILIQAGETVKIGTVACTIDTSVKLEIRNSEAETGNSELEIQNSKIGSQTPDPGPRTPDPANSELLNDRNSEFQTSGFKVSPVAQKMMEEHGLSVEDVVEGLKRIGKSEVETVINHKNQHPIPVAARDAAQTTRSEERKKMSQLRKKLSDRLVAVKNETAMLTTFNEVDMSAVMELRKKYQSQFEAKHGIKLGFMSFFTKAVTQALMLHPNVNSMLGGDDIVIPHYYDVAIAVQTDKGLMVPVLRNVEALSLSQIEKGIAELASKARAGRLSIGEMTGGTFTITNGGIFGSLLSTPIINPPQSAILGMHNIVERPVAINGKVEIRPMMYVALSYDHRIIDGKDSVGFLVHVKQFIESPVKLLLGNNEPEKLLLEL
jgi:2-oxoglutarate dehydrogenase E2 component (dihydrolipoamide succinyltransferase)